MQRQSQEQQSDEELLVSYILRSQNGPNFGSGMFVLANQMSVIKAYFKENPSEESYQKLCAHIEAEKAKSADKNTFAMMRHNIDSCRDEVTGPKPNI